jgi:hypothetical protein
LCVTCDVCRGVIVDQLQAQLENTRREELYGHEQPLDLSGHVSAGPVSKFSDEYEVKPPKNLAELQGQLEDQRREELFGHKAVLSLQGAIGADPSYPPPNYPVGRELNQVNPAGRDPAYPASNYPVGPEPNQIDFLKNEKVRDELFGYSRNAKGEKVSYQDLVKAAQERKVTCPECGCELTLAPGQTMPTPKQAGAEAEQGATEEPKELKEGVDYEDYFIPDDGGGSWNRRLLKKTNPPTEKEAEIIREQAGIAANDAEEARRFEVFGHRQTLDSRGRRRE